MVSSEFHVPIVEGWATSSCWMPLAAADGEVPVEVSEVFRNRQARRRPNQQRLAESYSSTRRARER